MTNEIELKLATRADEGAIRALLVECFPNNLKAEPAIMAWQYWDNPFGSTRSWLALDGDVVVGHYATYPLPVLLRGKRQGAGIGVDAATKPSHRGRKIFETMARRLYQDCADHDMAITMVFASANSVKGVMNVGVKRVHYLDTFVKPLSSDWLRRAYRIPTPVGTLARRTATAALVRVRGRQVDRVPADVEGLWQRTVAPDHTGIQRDYAWWNWRYDLAPGLPYRLFEFREAGTLRAIAAATPRMEGEEPMLYVLDLLFETPRYGASLLEHIARDASGTVAMAVSTSPGTPVTAACRWAGLRHLPDRLAPWTAQLTIRDLTPGEQAVSAPWRTLAGDQDHL